jgi:hypothetical protein
MDTEVMPELVFCYIEHNVAIFMPYGTIDGFRFFVHGKDWRWRWRVRMGEVA